MSARNTVAILFVLMRGLSLHGNLYLVRTEYYVVVTQSENA
jgi:hypothetical protein